MEVAAAAPAAAWLLGATEELVRVAGESERGESDPGPGLGLGLGGRGGWRPAAAGVAGGAAGWAIRRAQQMDAAAGAVGTAAELLAAAVAALGGGGVDGGGMEESTLEAAAAAAAELAAAVYDATPPDPSSPEASTFDGGVVSRGGGVTLGDGSDGSFSLDRGRQLSAPQPISSGDGDANDVTAAIPSSFSSPAAPAHAFPTAAAAVFRAAPSPLWSAPLARYIAAPPAERLAALLSDGTRSRRPEAVAAALGTAAVGAVLANDGGGEALRAWLVRMAAAGRIDVAAAATAWIASGSAAGENAGGSGAGGSAGGKP